MSHVLEGVAPATTDAFDAIVAGAVPRMPGRRSVDAAAAALAAQCEFNPYTPDSLLFSMGKPLQRDRGDWYAVSVTPGRVKVRTMDMATPRPAAPPRGVIYEWSAGSRRRMHSAIADIDLEDWDQDEGTLAMVTLTLPDEWLTIAPTAKAWQACIERLRLYWRQAGYEWRGVWKKEFQRRGAPHLHAMMRVPALASDGRPFEQWLAETWVRACKTEQLLGVGEALKQLAAHSPAPKRHLGEHGSRACQRAKCRPNGCIDLSAKMTDPRRIAVYFGKHSAKTGDSKEYQHRVPDQWRVCVEGHPWRSGCGHPLRSVGRFWGIWGLNRVEREILVTRCDFDRLARILRKISAARHAGKELALLRACGLRVGRSRLTRYRSRSLRNDTGGFVLVNDGPRTAFTIARALALIDS